MQRSNGLGTLLLSEQGFSKMVAFQTSKIHQVHITFLSIRSMTKAREVVLLVNLTYLLILLSCPTLPYMVLRSHWWIWKPRYFVVVFYNIYFIFLKRPPSWIQILIRYKVDLKLKSFINLWSKKGIVHIKNWERCGCAPLTWILAPTKPKSHIC